VGVADNDTGNDAVDRALRVLVYGPVGIACYLKDSAPTFMDLFVSRGKREVDGVRRAVEEKLGVAKPAPTPSPQQRVTDSIGSLSKAAAQAGSVAAAMAGPMVKAGAGAAASAAASAARTVGGVNGGAPADDARPGGIPSVGNPETAVAGAAAVPHDRRDLPISGYDGLSASQVIERLEGLSRGALERVRAYELAHRARRTILASIDQLTS
jgi:hypothetical protein